MSEAPVYKQATKTIAVDFDGVIHWYTRGWQGGDIYDDPVPGAIRGLMKLMNAGFEVVIFTTRLNKDDFPDNENQHALIQEWLLEQAKKVFDPPNGSWPVHPGTRLQWTAVNFVTMMRLTAVKPPAIAYIDDRGIRFTNWPDMLKYFL